MSEENFRPERRWAIIASDGRHSWLGRHSDPTPEELETLTARLHAQGAVTWLAVTEGVYYSTDTLSILIVGPLTGSGDPAAAIQAFQEMRRQNLEKSK
jgi:hypothetical protein